MRERLSSVGHSTADIARTFRRGASRTAKAVTTDALPVTLTLCAGATGGFLASGNPTLENTAAPGALGVTLCLLGKSFVDRTQRDRDMVGFGLERGIEMGAVLGNRLPTPDRVLFQARSDGEPLYSSLDGSTVITDPGELLGRIGDPEQVATRVGVMIRKAEHGRPVTEDQVDYFRLVQAGLDLIPGAREILCDRGQGIVEKMDTIVTTYMEEHPPQPPTPPQSA